MAEKKWFKIGETAERLGVTAKDLRYWESVIPEIRPRRSKGNLRYYHADELPRLMRIREWIREGLSAVDCRGLLLTGQAAPALDLGLDPAELAPSPKGRRPESGSASRRAAPNLRLGHEVQPAIQALRELLLRLGGPSSSGTPSSAPSAPGKRASPRKPVLDPPPGLF